MYFKVLQTHFWRKRVPGVPTKAQQSTRKGVCRIRSAAKLLTAALWGLVGKGGTAKRVNFCPLKGKMKDTKLVPTQSEDAFVRCCLWISARNRRPLQRGTDIPMHHQPQPIHDLLRLGLHAALDPLDHQPHQRVLIYIGNKRLVLFGYLQAR